MSKGRVFIIQKPLARRPMDFSRAAEYGQLVFVFESEDKPSLSPGDALDRVNRVMLDFDPDEDFICWSGGDPFGLMLCTMVASRASGGKMAFLRFERKRDEKGNRTGTGFYIPVYTDIYQERSELNKWQQ